MREFFAAVVVSLGLGGFAQAQEAEIEANILAQMDAFRADDFGAAFDYASPAIRQIFRTPENFGAMVRNGYPMVWRPGDVRFLDLRDVAGTLWQKVMIVDRDGRVHILDYQMIRGENGWKINGVQVLGANDPAA
ncbi:DUF4864 domain-containing protein [Ruegeria sediminis]|uniref:DUF4864 domain-containing protein n=1 Tax=Ruegeria sediminis TaxID=2583820 RepID=A0ABY2X502_9RHOB|nr:DUF4864 domain-containing protein [Ruegeria sediminis]TMV10124.1 DUF4864 domain-containing protein [Ruegeria sediminis]